MLESMLSPLNLHRESIRSDGCNALYVEDGATVLVSLEFLLQGIPLLRKCPMFTAGNARVLCC